MAVSGNYHWLPNGTIGEISEGQSQTSNSKKKNNNDIMGKDQFLKLLITQLRYQDPLNPMEDKDFIAQTAQFSALEQMTNMSRSFAGVQANTYLGKIVVVNDPETGQLIQGIVDQTIYKDGDFTVVVGNKEYELKDIQIVLDSGADFSSLQLLVNMGMDIEMMKASSLIGKKVVALDSTTTNESDTIEGIVTEVKLVDNAYKIIIDGKEIDLRHVRQVTSA